MNCDRDLVRSISFGKKTSKDICVSWDIGEEPINKDILSAAEVLRNKITGKNVFLNFINNDPCNLPNLKEILEILFKDNETTGSVTIITGLTNTKEYFEDLLTADTGNVAVIFSVSYNWEDLQPFYERLIAIRSRTEKISVRCYVDDTKSVSDLETLAEFFSAVNVKFCPVGESFQEGVKEFCERTLTTSTKIVAELSNGSYDRYSTKKEVADAFERFRGFICSTGLIINPDFSLSAGVCSQKKSYCLCDDIRKDDGFSLEQNTEVCLGKNKCNLGQVQWIWNGLGKQPE